MLAWLNFGLWSQIRRPNRGFARGGPIPGGLLLITPRWKSEKFPWQSLTTGGR